MIELSIIVPVYKVEAYLHKCIESILSQTFTDFELILIDDGSPDRCGAICDEYAAMDSRIVVIHQKNLGVSAARNAGLKIAKGGFIGFVDSDDWINPEMYETMMRLAKQHRLDVVMCGADHWSEDGVLLYHDLPKEKEYANGEELMIGLYGTPNIFSGALWNKIFSAECVRSAAFDSSLKMAEDWIFLADVLFQAKRGLKIADPLYNYLERTSSVTRSKNFDLVFDHIFRARFALYQRGLRYKKRIAASAAKKYLDDCLRYTPEIRVISKETHQKCGAKIFQIKLRMLHVILRSLILRRLPVKVLFGFWVGMNRL